MLRTRTDLWLMALMGSLGLNGGCGANTEGQPSPSRTAQPDPGQPEQSDAGTSPSVDPNRDLSMPALIDDANPAANQPSVDPDCDVSTPVMIGDVDTSTATCTNGIVHRPGPVHCPNTLAERPQTGPKDWPGTCKLDSECSDAPYGYCGTQGIGPLICKYGCVTDADCAENQLCQCGETIGTCVDATCRSDAECSDGQLCAQFFRRIGWDCGEPPQYACQTDADECQWDSDCPREAYNCAVEDGRRTCLPIFPGGACGRPFLVAGAARLAALGASADWCVGSTELPGAAIRGHVEVRASDAPLARSQREYLGQYWAQIGLMEHASIAAFARFTLQLMQLGAPFELVTASQQAALDETRHARDCFSLARGYLDGPVGPQALSMTGALNVSDLDEVLRLVFREGCIGETVAALQACEALALCEDPAVAAVLRRISADEARHAELAWRFVDWALQHNAALCDVLEAECERADTAQVTNAVTTSFDTAPHGVLSAPQLARVEAAALRDVIRPCAAALIARRRDHALEQRLARA